MWSVTCVGGWASRSVVVIAFYTISDGKDIVVMREDFSFVFLWMLPTPLDHMPCHCVDAYLEPLPPPQALEIMDSRKFLQNSRYVRLRNSSE